MVLAIMSETFAPVQPSPSDDSKNKNEQLSNHSKEDLVAQLLALREQKRLLEDDVESLKHRLDTVREAFVEASSRTNDIVCTLSDNSSPSEDEHAQPDAHPPQSQPPRENCASPACAQSFSSIQDRLTGLDQIFREAQHIFADEWTKPSATSLSRLLDVPQKSPSPSAVDTSSLDDPGISFSLEGCSDLAGEIDSLTLSNPCDEAASAPAAVLPGPDIELSQQLSDVQAERDRLAFQIDLVFREKIDKLCSDTIAQTNTSLPSLDERLQLCESTMLAMKKDLPAQMHALTAELKKLHHDRARAHSQMQRLQSVYDKLLGLHRKRAEELQNEVIDLPNSIEELQELALQLREELIESRTAREHQEETLKGELVFMREQLEAANTEREQLESNFAEELTQVRTELALARSRAESTTESEAGSTKAEREDVLRSKEMRIETLEGELASTRQQVVCLQQDLNNAVSVQKDFVGLSKSLQIELEKIRQGENEVRWQHDEDVLICSGACKGVFNKQRRKQHCYHCGKIFCHTCLTRTVPSGPKQRPSPVCDVCHTILVEKAPPYFNVQPPQDT